MKKFLDIIQEASDDEFFGDNLENVPAPGEENQEEADTVQGVEEPARVDSDEPESTENGEEEPSEDEVDAESVTKVKDIIKDLVAEKFKLRGQRIEFYGKKELLKAFKQIEKYLKISADKIEVFAEETNKDKFTELFEVLGQDNIKGFIEETANPKQDDIEFEIIFYNFDKFKFVLLEDKRESNKFIYK